ncbi:MAG: zinc ribbon domain-containing protein [Treponema sp.]|nr:zinc ribbon domain-containing protein [Treponema sp.]
MAKSPRFFCENCGAEVNRDSKTCPRCGRYFASVRCPSCGFTGAEDLFTGGCPVCGYSSPGSGNLSRFTAKKSSRKKPPRIAAGALPLWVYIITIFFLLCLFGMFFFILR